VRYRQDTGEIQAYRRALPKIHTRGGLMMMMAMDLSDRPFDQSEWHRSPDPDSRIIIKK